MEIEFGNEAESGWSSFLPEALSARGGLAPRHLRRAKAMLLADLEGKVALETVARACGLSASYFSRAFHVSVGAPPRRWALAHRIRAAQAAIRAEQASLAEIALRHGFSDQSHFTRVFTRLVGISPGAWAKRASSSVCWTIEGTELAAEQA
jgi:AraC-like DNA-binding protein